jgi:preprotein translocase subunit SecE
MGGVLTVEDVFDVSCPFQKENRVANKDEKSVAVKKPNAIQRYISETVGELRKVSWPTRKEATNLTIIVLVVTIAFGLYLGLMDFLFSRFFALLFA